MYAVTVRSSAGHLVRPDVGLEPERVDRPDRRPGGPRPTEKDSLRSGGVSVPSAYAVGLHARRQPAAAADGHRVPLLDRRRQGEELPRQPPGFPRAASGSTPCPVISRKPMSCNAPVDRGGHRGAIGGVAVNHGLAGRRAARHPCSVLSDASPMSSNHSSGRAAMNSVISPTHSGSSSTVIADAVLGQPVVAAVEGLRLADHHAADAELADQPLSSTSTATAWSP